MLGFQLWPTDSRLTKQRIDGSFKILANVVKKISRKVCLPYKADGRYDPSSQIDQNPIVIQKGKRMSNVATPATHDKHSSGRLNYLDQAAESSLYRNGKLMIQRNIDGSDSGLEGVAFDERQVTVHNARLLSGAERRTVEANGFEVLTRPLQRLDLDFFDHQEVIREYYPQCTQLVSEVTGASSVFAFDHNIRSASGKQSQQRIRGGQEVQGPARMAHGDYTLRSAPERLHQLAQPPSINDTLRSILEEGQSLIPPEKAEHALNDDGRFSIINVWRNIVEEPVATHPLALCDAQSVTPEDLVVFEIHYSDRIGENYFSKYAPQHQWYYYPAMTRDEAMLIKQWDSAGALARSKGDQADGDDAQSPCTFSFHSAFQDPATPADAPDRWSIEVRCMVVFD